MRRGGSLSPNSHERAHETFTHWRYITRETTLSADDAETLAANPSAIFIRRATAALARHRHRLNLNGLEMLDAGVATALAGFRGSLLSPDGVTRLTVKAAGVTTVPSGPETALLTQSSRPAHTTNTSRSYDQIC